MLDVLWFFLPAGIANMMPLLANKLVGPGTPVHKKWFGSHKTWQGLVTATLGGWAFYLLQMLVMPMHTSVFLGFWLGFGAIMGDLVESFCKRKIGIKPGRPWIPFDQLDWILGAMLCSLPFVTLAIVDWLAIVVCYFLLGFVASRIGYWTGMRKEKY